MADSGNENYRWPDEYLPAVHGALPYAQMLEAYKRYKVFLNINSVRNSPTMFSRRVFELLACGTPVISSYSEGIAELLGPDLVLMSDDEQTTRELIERVLNDAEYRERLALCGQRKVFSEHTYGNRLQFMLDTIGLRRSAVGRPPITMIAAVSSVAELAAAHEIFRRQKYEHKRLIICANSSTATESVDRITGGASDVRVLTLDDAPWGRMFQEVVRNCDEGFVAALNPAHSYGPHYLTDYANATLYVTEPAIGKATFYETRAGADATVAQPGNEYRVVGAVNPWTLCLSRARAAQAAKKLDAAQTPDEWWNRTMRDLERAYSTDRFNYVQCTGGRPGPQQPTSSDSRFVAAEPRQLQVALA